MASTLEQGGEGEAGEVKIDTKTLSLTNGATILASTFAKGNGGKINITADSVFIDGEGQGDSNSGVASTVTRRAEGNAGEVKIDTGTLSVTNGAAISASTFAKGNGGKINITADSVSIDGEGKDGFYSAVGSSVQPNAEGNGGEVRIDTGTLSVTNGGVIGSTTFGKGNAGKINITADSISFDGEGQNRYSQFGIGNRSGTFSQVARSSIKGDGGEIQIDTNTLSLTNKAIVSTESLGRGNAGSLKINARSIILDNNSSIVAANTPSANISTTLSGGNIDLQISDNLILRNSDISTQASINSNGGNIDITADAVIAFDDSDIFAFAADGQGGNITLDTPAYFAENFTLNSLTSNPDTLQNNSRADVNATGAVSGSVSIPDVSFVQNSLNTLPNNSLNTDELVANSCVMPVSDRKEGKFYITGTQGFPLRPGDGLPSRFSTGEVRNVPEQSSWQPGDPIIEPQGAYRLANGKLVLSRECSR